MTSTNFLLEVELQIKEAFESQNPELFDVIFEIGGKKLYADKLRLSVISPMFKTMFSKEWIKTKTEPIIIKDYKFEDFKEFLTFIYSGQCHLTSENIFDILDMAEFYQINQLKHFCDQFLATKMEFNLSNVIQYLELSSKYSLVVLKEWLHIFISQNYVAFIQSNKFLSTDKLIIEELVTFTQSCLEREQLLQAAYHWAENQAIKKQRESEDENYNLNEAIKTEMIPFLPYFQLEKLKLKFLREYVVRKDFLFSNDQLNDILNKVNFDYKVTITNSRGQRLHGIIPYDSDAIKILKSLKNSHSNNGGTSIIFWETKHRLPLMQNSLKKRGGVQWYLFYYQKGNIGVRHCSELTYSDYLLAELKTETSGFVFTTSCKIEIEK